MPAPRPGRMLTAAALALGATLLTGTVALAAPAPPPSSGDDRATAFAGNVTTCAEAGLQGDTVVFPNVDASGTDITITSSDIPAGDTILAVVVKGGPAYNVYQGLTSWTDLHSPINPGGQIPTISHWFACVSKSNGGGGGTTTTSPAPTSTSGGSGGTTTTTTGSGGGPSPATSTAAVAGATTTSTGTGTKNLAFTGFGNNWLIWAGLLLVLAGGGVLALTRLRRRSS